MADSDDTSLGRDRSEREGAGDSLDLAVVGAELRARRIGLGIIIAVSLAFIASSSWQIIPAVFGARIEPLPDAPQGSPDRACAVGVRSLLGALDRIAGQVLPPWASDDQTVAALGARLSPEWDQAGAIARACEGSPQGEQAWAALQRMKMAEDQPIRMGRDALAVLHLEVAEHLPSDLR